MHVACFPAEKSAPTESFSHRLQIVSLVDNRIYLSRCESFVLLFSLQDSNLMHGFPLGHTYPQALRCSQALWFLGSPSRLVCGVLRPVTRTMPVSCVPCELHYILWLQYAENQFLEGCKPFWILLVFVRLNRFWSSNATYGNNLRSALLFFDHLFVTLGAEISFIWTKPKAASAYWFFLNRYIAFFGNILVMALGYDTLPETVRAIVLSFWPLIETTSTEVLKSSMCPANSHELIYTHQLWCLQLFSPSTCHNLSSYYLQWDPFLSIRSLRIDCLYLDSPVLLLIRTYALYALSVRILIFLITTGVILLAVVVVGFVSLFVFFYLKLIISSGPWLPKAIPMKPM